MYQFIYITGNILLALYFIYTLLGIWRGAPPIPTLKNTRETMIRLGEIQQDDLVIDLGSGDGRVLISAARAGGRAIGYELNPFLYWYSRLVIKVLGLSDRITVHRQTLWDAPFEDADVITAYLGPSVMKALEPIVTTRMKVGARFVANAFPFPNLSPIERCEKVYKYLPRSADNAS